VKSGGLAGTATYEFNDAASLSLPEEDGIETVGRSCRSQLDVYRLDDERTERRRGSRPVSRGFRLYSAPRRASTSNPSAVKKRDEYL